MDERSLIYDWNTVDYDLKRNPANHPHGVWFDDETLRDGLQSPSARNPTIEQKIELLTFMETLGLQKVDLGLPGAGPFHLEHIDAMLSHITENDYQIRPGAAVRTLMNDIEPLVELQAKHGIPIQASAFLGTSPIRQYTEGWTMEKLVSTMEKAVSFAVDNDVPVMFVTEDTTRSNPEDVKMIYQRAMELGNKFTGEAELPEGLAEWTAISVSRLAGTAFLGLYHDPRHKGNPPGLTVSCCEIELDLETGKYEILDYTAIADCGTPKPRNAPEGGLFV